MNISDRNSDRNFDLSSDRNSDRNSDWNSARNSAQNFRSRQLPEFVLEKLAIIVLFLIPLEEIDDIGIIHRELKILVLYGLGLASNL